MLWVEHHKNLVMLYLRVYICHNIHHQGVTSWIIYIVTYTLFKCCIESIILFSLVKTSIHDLHNVGKRSHYFVGQYYKVKSSYRPPFNLDVEFILFQLNICSIFKVCLITILHGTLRCHTSCLWYFNAESWRKRNQF